MSHDPTDFICSDNFETLKLYMPCQGERGIFALIDQTKIFKNDYISLLSEINYDR